jgi:hypothetical protein
MRSSAPASRLPPLLALLVLGVAAVIVAILAFGHAPPSGEEVRARATAACERAMRASGMLGDASGLDGAARPRVDATVGDARVFLVAGVLPADGGRTRAYLCTYDSRDGSASARWPD